MLILECCINLKQPLTRFTSPFHRQLVGSRNVAIEVIALFDAAIEHFADEGRWQTFEHFIEQLSKLGSQLQQAGPKGMSGALSIQIEFMVIYANYWNRTSHRECRKAHH